MTRRGDNPIRSPKNADELLDMYFLDARSHLLEAAAILDRIERAPKAGKVMREERLNRLRLACDILKTDSGNRVEQFLLLFSDMDGLSK